MERSRGAGACVITGARPTEVGSIRLGECAQQGAPGATRRPEMPSGNQVGSARGAAPGEYGNRKDVERRSVGVSPRPVLSQAF